MNPRARRAHIPDPDPLDDPRHEPPTDVEVDYFRDLGFVDDGLSADDDYRVTGHWAMGEHHFR